MSIEPAGTIPLPAVPRAYGPLGMAVLLFVSFLSGAPALGAEDRRALDLLSESLETPVTPYEGEMRIVTDGPGGGSRELMVRFSPPASFRRQAVDELGIPVWTVVSDGRTQWVYDRRRRAAFRSEPADPDFKLMDADRERRLMARNYSFRLAGKTRVADRDCAVVEVVSRGTGRRTQRLAVDEEYGVLLARETFGPDGRRTSERRFLRIELPARSEGWDFGFKPPPGVKIVRRGWEPDFLGLEEAADVADRRPAVPAWLPPGYVFESADLLPYRDASLLHLRFTDGIDVLSLFQCPPGARLSLPAAGPAPGRVLVRGQPARLVLLPEGKLLEWGSRERFVLLGPLAAETLRRVAESVEDAGRSSL